MNSQQRICWGGREALADVFLERSWRLYREWNGYRKAHLLAGEHAHLRVLDEVANRSDKETDPPIEPTSTGSLRPVRATESINDLLEELCHAANADWGAVFRLTHGALELETARDTTRDAESVRASAIVRYVAKSGTSVAIRVLPRGPAFHRLPLSHGVQTAFGLLQDVGDVGDPTGVVYLENRLMPSIFSDATVAATRSHLATVAMAMARNRMLADLQSKQSHLEQTQRQGLQARTSPRALGQVRTGPGQAAARRESRCAGHGAPGTRCVGDVRRHRGVHPDERAPRERNRRGDRRDLFLSFRRRDQAAHGEIVEKSGDWFHGLPFENPTS